MNEITNNKVKLTGTVVSEPEFIYEVYGEQFFNLFLEVKRISGVADIVPLTISERLFNLEDKFTGTVVRVSGQFRSFKDVYKRQCVLNTRDTGALSGE